MMINDSLLMPKTADAKDKDSASPIHVIQPVREGPENDLNALRKTVQRAGCNGYRPSDEGIAAELVGMDPLQRASALRGLQQTRGNGYVGRLAIQAKLAIGQPSDQYEQEADRVAEQVMRMPDPQSVPSGSHLKTKEISGQNAGTTPDLESRINAIRGGGQPMEKSERAFFEPRFGADFSRVRIHTGAQAGESARAINARAFTLGQDVVLGPGEYAPETEVGRQLLAHELVHVIQQKGGQLQQRAVQREVLTSGPEFEEEMERPMRYPPSWLCPEGIEFFRHAERGLNQTEMRNFGDPITIVEPGGERQNRALAYFIGEQSGRRRYYATTQEQIVWASPTEIQCFRYYDTPVEDASPIARSHHDANLLMYRYVELEGMSPYSARDRIMSQDAELGSVLQWMCMAAGA